MVASTAVSTQLSTVEITSFGASGTLLLRISLTNSWISLVCWMLPNLSELLAAVSVRTVPTDAARLLAESAFTVARTFMSANVRAELLTCVVAARISRVRDVVSWSCLIWVLVSFSMFFLAPKMNCFDQGSRVLNSRWLGMDDPARLLWAPNVIRLFGILAFGIRCPRLSRIPASMRDILIKVAMVLSRAS